MIADSLATKNSQLEEQSKYDRDLKTRSCQCVLGVGCVMSDVCRLEELSV